MAKLTPKELARQLNELITRLDPGGAPAYATEPGDAIESLVAAVTAAEARWEADRARVDWLDVGLAHVTEGVMLVDASGAIVHSNARAEAFVGARHGDAIVERALVGLLGRALVGEPVSEVVELWGPPRRALQLSATPLEDGDTIVGALALIEDITERRRLEAIRRDFVANISHELKTPVGALGLLSEALADEDEQEIVRRLAGRLQSEAARLGRIIDDLLDLSRIEAEEHPVREPVPIHLLVGEAVERTRTKAEHRAVHLDVADIHLGLSVIGDRRQLVSAVQNVLENAIKYSDDNATVHVSATSAEGEVEIQVVDNGIGIPARDLERIFERFYRVDRARARDTGGTGLGLSIVRHVCHNHRGEVFVESREGEGSTFVLRFPAGPLLSQTGNPLAERAVEPVLEQYEPIER